VAKCLGDKVSTEGQTVREDFKKIIQCTDESCLKSVDTVLGLHAKGSEERAVLRNYMTDFDGSVMRCAGWSRSRSRLGEF
jgi:hypothetical protein